MAEKQCTQCGVELPDGAHGARRYCSRRCRDKSNISSAFGQARLKRCRQNAKAKGRSDVDRARDKRRNVVRLKEPGYRLCKLYADQRRKGYSGSPEEYAEFIERYRMRCYVGREWTVARKPIVSGSGARRGQRLWRQNAEQAWHHWMHVRAPDWWLQSYYEVDGRPWNNPRLSVAEAYCLRYQANPTFMLWERHRRQFKKWMNGERRSLPKSVSYSRDEFKVHIERQFVNGMSWDNYGEWHVDHITPKNRFDPRSEQQVRSCWALPNLRPLWAGINCGRSKAGDTLL